MEISLALGGGGVKGIAHIGVLACLVKAGFKIRSIAGTSAGGLVGAVFAAGYDPEEILTLIESLNRDRLYARSPTDGPSLLGYTGLAEALTEVLGKISFDELKIPFACTAVDLGTSQEVYLGEGQVLDAVLATIAVPGIFPPKLRGKTELIDGGILDPVPVNLARLLTPELPVVAVALNPERAQWPQVPQFHVHSPVPLPIPPPIAEGISRMRVARAFQIFIQSIDITARLMTELRLEADRPDVIVRPDVHHYGLLEPVPPKDLFQLGFQAAKNAVPKIHASLSWPNVLRRKLGLAGRLNQKVSPRNGQFPFKIQEKGKR